MDLQFKHLKVNTVPGRNAVMNILELKDYIDFEVKRVYYTTSVAGDTSQHAHHNEKELFVIIQGACTAVIDSGNGLEEVRIDSPSDALYVGNYVWHGFKDFAPNSVLLALSSTNYTPDRSDYLESYQEYKDFIQNKE
jgi:mannose-6-phosphate isomerase-like protein (cupin superfamily)